VIKKEPRKAALKVKQGEKSDPIRGGECLSPEALDENSDNVERLIFG
jgi:hypothetical protein